MKKILFTGDTLTDERRSELKNRGYDVIPAAYDLSADAVADMLKECDGYILGGDEIASREMLDKAGDRLKAICFFGAGYEKYIDAQAAKEKGICVANTPGANANSVAEFTVGLMMSAIKNINRNNCVVKKGEWDRPITFDLSGKTVGIIGMGRIGEKVAKILYNGFGAKILYTSRKSKLAVESSCWAKKVTLDELLDKSDIISIHASLNDETKNMLGTEEISKMKSGVVIVDTARVEIINEEALLNGLKTGKVSICAFDGFYEEPVNAGTVERHELLRLPDDKIIVTPHMAYYTSDAIQNMENMSIDNVIEMLTTGKCKYQVNG